MIKSRNIGRITTQHGSTLIELMVTFAVAAIVPAWMISQQINGDTQQGNFVLCDNRGFNDQSKSISIHATSPHFSPPFVARRFKGAA